MKPGAACEMSKQAAPFRLVGFEEPKTVKMNGLRIYVNPMGTKMPGECSVFYSRRADGPYYRWRYEDTLGRWRVSRVHPSGLVLKALCMTSWKTVPTALQARLGE